MIRSDSGSLSRFLSQIVHRHPQSSPVRDKILCLVQWTSYDHSRDCVSGIIASCSWCLDSFQRFSASQWSSLTSCPLHRTRIRWCVEKMRRLHNKNFHESYLLFLMTICSNSRRNVTIIKIKRFHDVFTIEGERNGTV